MTRILIRGCLSALAFTFLLAAFACTGPQGPPGPVGPPGFGEGPPHVWICEPANSLFAQQGNFGSLYVFNGSSATANLAVHFLDQDGVNLAGVAIPGSQPGEVYPGQPGDNTQALLPAHTLTLRWRLPRFAQDSGVIGGNLGLAVNQLANRSSAIRVTSNQPIFVSAEYQLTNTNPIACSRLTK